MRSLILATLIVLDSVTASGQANINKGDWMLGGSGSLSSYQEGGYKVNTVQISPDFGYFFFNRFAGGLRTDMSFYKWPEEPGKSSSYEISVSPFARYYFLPSTQKVNVFADASAGVGQQNRSGSNVYRYTTNQFAIKAGPAIFLTPSTALEIALSYTSRHKQYSDLRSEELELTVGFQVHLPGRKK